jgi:hypothetical protein
MENFFGRQKEKSIWIDSKTQTIHNFKCLLDSFCYSLSKRKKKKVCFVLKRDSDLLVSNS